MKKCTEKLHIDMPLFIGNFFSRFVNYLNTLDLYGISTNPEDTQSLINIIDAAYIQPFWSIYKKHLEETTGHDVNIGGNGQLVRVEYLDVPATFEFEIREYGRVDVDVYYGGNASNDMCLDFIHRMEFIFARHRFLDLYEEAQEMEKKRLEWLKSMKDTKELFDEDDYDDDEEAALWQEYLSEIHEGFDEWKERRKNKKDTKGPDLKAGTLMYFDGDEWKEITGITNVEISQEDEATNFYADDAVYYQFEPEYEFSFTCTQVSDALADVVNKISESLKKSHSSSEPP